MASTYALSVSTQSNHSGAVALNGSTLNGSVYIFTSSASQLTNYDPSGISKVCFWLDNTAMSGTATHCEGVMPYDFAGSANNTSTSLANAWNANSVANGTHTITQQVTMTIGTVEVDTASFTVGTSSSSTSTTATATVSPSSATVNTGATQQFTAAVTGSTNTSVSWQVNGVGGGNSTYGTITSAGLYTAPATAPSSSVQVKAVPAAGGTAGTASVTVKAATTTATVSASGTTIPPASQIVDSQNAVWTVSGGYIYRNGTQVPSANVILLLYYNGVVYQENSSQAWWAWINGAWSTSSDPRTTTSTAPTVTTTSLSGAKQNTAYSTTLAGSGGTTPYTWSLASGSLPSGVSLASSGTISGTPTVSGSFAFSVKLTDAKGQTASANETLSVAAATTTTVSPSGTTIPPASQIVDSQNAVWTVSGGYIYRNGTQVPSANVILLLYYNGVVYQENSSQAWWAWINGAWSTSSDPRTTTSTAPAVTTTSLPGATQNAAYSTTLSGSGGTTPYSWSLASGSLPSGVSLASTGTISGTPTVSGSFAFAVKLTDAKGQTASANETLSVAAAASSSTGSTSGSGSPFFSTTSFINTKLPSNISVDPNSASMVANSIASQASAAHLSNYSYGVGLVYSSASDKVYSVACTTYDSATCLVGSSINFPIPKGATPPSGTDHNTSFIYTANDGSPYAGMELDCWIAQYNSTNDTWSCGTASLVKNTTSGWGTCAEANITSYHCNGGYAAGFDFAAGPIRPEEIKAGFIPHALVIAISNPGSGIVCPATHTDHSGTGIPEGGHFFLPASFNVAAAASAGGWPAWVTTVAYALQNYGGYVVDYGGSFEIKGFTDQNPGSISWSSVGVALDGWSNLAMLPWSQMQVETMQSCN